MRYNKLVRDNTPEQIIEDGNQVRFKKISTKEEFIWYANKKVLEEAKELYYAVKGPADKNEIINEVADLAEIVKVLTKALGISDEEVREIQKIKAANIGGFEKGIILQEVK